MLPNLMGPTFLRLGFVSKKFRNQGSRFEGPSKAGDCEVISSQTFSLTPVRGEGSRFNQESVFTSDVCQRNVPPPPNWSQNQRTQKTENPGKLPKIKEKLDYSHDFLLLTILEVLTHKFSTNSECLLKPF